MRYVYVSVFLIVLSLLLLSLPQVKTSTGSSISKDVLMLDMTYIGVLQIKSEGNITSEIMTKSAPSQVLSLFIHYKVEVRMFFNTSSMNIDKCDLRLVIMDISTDPQHLAMEITEELKEYENITVLNCTMPPIVLVYSNNTIQLNEPKTSGVAMAFTRLDVDMLQIMGSYYDLTPGDINYSNWHIYIEPLTNIPVLYSEVRNIRLSQGGYCYVVVSVYLSDYRHIFDQIINRDTFDLIITVKAGDGSSLTENKLTFVLLHLVERTNGTSQDERLFKLKILGNDTLLMIYEKEVPCYVIIGPLDPDLSIKNSNLALATYITFNNKRIYYTPSVITCRVLRFTLPGDIVNVEPPLTIEKSIPPRPHYPLMIENIVLTVLAIFGTLYILYSVINKLVTMFIIEKHS
ncbi:MAG: hypothetical protein QXP02_04895 [Desulfurococcaceae archaeon]